jgi:hypothetical protein
VPFTIYAKLLGEQGGEPLIEGNQVLGVFPALEFILGAQISEREIQGSKMWTHSLEKRDISPAS